MAGVRLSCPVAIPFNQAIHSCGRDRSVVNLVSVLLLEEHPRDHDDEDDHVRVDIRPAAGRRFAMTVAGRR